MSEPSIWIVAPVYEREEHLLRLVNCLKDQTHHNYQLVVVDHGKNALKIELDDSRIEVIRGKPKMWWTAAVNQGIRHVLNKKTVNAKTPIIIQNDDVTFNPDYLELLIADWHYREDVIIGSVNIDRDSNKIIRADMVYNEQKTRLMNLSNGLESQQLSFSEPSNVDVLTGRGTLIPVKVFLNVGLYEERFLPHYRADYELIYRAKKKGYVVLVSPRALIYTKEDSACQLNSSLNSKIKYLTARKSIKNVKDLFFYSYLCFGFKKGTVYFFLTLKGIIYNILNTDKINGL